jgi:hypothetical protein
MEGSKHGEDLCKFQVSGVSPAAGSRSGQFDRKEKAAMRSNKKQISNHEYRMSK